MEQNGSFKKFSYISAGNVIGTILQALFYLLFAAMLGPESYGQLNVIIALAGTFSVISRFGLGQTLQIYQAKKNSKLSHQVNTIFVILTGVAALILVTIDVYAAVLCVGVSFFLMHQHNLLGLRHYKKYMISSLQKNGTILLIPILFYFVLEIPGIVLGMAISNFLATIPFFRDLKIKSFFDLKKHYKILLHNFGVDLSMSLPFMIDKLLIASLFGFFTVGVYQFNLQILFALAVLPGALFTFLLSEESSGVSHKKISILVIFGSTVITVVSIALLPFFVNEIFPKYSEGIFSLQILVLSIIPLSISSVFTAKLMAKESTRIGFSSIIMTGMILGLIVLLGKIYGLVGLSLAILLTIIINTIFLSILYYNSKH